MTTSNLIKAFHWKFPFSNDPDEKEEAKNLNNPWQIEFGALEICISSKHSTTALKVFTVVALPLSQQSTMFGYLESVQWKRINTAKQYQTCPSTKDTPQPSLALNSAAARTWLLN
ncbi:Bifunctional protein HldE [Trichinella pseudospiralis]